METSIGTRKKSGKGKALICAGAIAGTLIVGGALKVDKAVGRAYDGVRGAISDFFTYDVGERAEDLVKKLEKEKKLGKYTVQIQNVVYGATKYLPDEQKKKALTQVIKESDKQLQVQIFEYMGQSVDAQEKSRFIQSNLSALSIDEAKSTYKSLDKIIEADNRKHPTFLQKIWYGVDDLYHKAADKLSGKPKAEAKK